MAATALDILSAERLKQHLRLPAAHTSENELLETIIGQAVDVVSRDSGAPLIDSTRIAYADIPTDNDKPMCLEEEWFTFDTTVPEHDIDYWRTQDNIAEEPQGAIPRSEIGRTLPVLGGRGYLIYTNAEWPQDVLPGTRARITGRRGIEKTPLGLEAAIIIMCRHLYSGEDVFKARHSYWRYLGPYRSRVPAL